MVALVVSQLLLPSEPVALPRHAEEAALREMASALDQGAAAVEVGDTELTDRGVTHLQDVGVQPGRPRKRPRHQQPVSPSLALVVDTGGLRGARERRRRAAFNSLATAAWY
ncbi:hypothetical protein [Streptomyces sp. NPDC002215]|uniref:hypothetical protein n=1 Tax=Streptomyces sp. NPDC002215 TaxID=3154412 RepID=UPI003322C3E2